MTTNQQKPSKLFGLATPAFYLKKRTLNRHFPRPAESDPYMDNPLKLFAGDIELQINKGAREKKNMVSYLHCGWDMLSGKLPHLPAQ